MSVMAESATHLGLHTLDLDFVADELRIEGARGSICERLSTALPGLPPDFRRVTVDLAAREAALVLASREEVQLALGDQRTRPHGSVVFLDTNHWISLARHRYAPQKMDSRERGPALRLLELVDERRITVAVGSTNLVEVTAADGRHREHAATTMLRVSRGWQMRNVLDVRQDELDASLAGQPSVARQVFTLEPGVIFSGPRSQPPGSYLEPGLAESIADIWTRLGTALGLWAAVLENERLPSEDGYKAAESWAQSFKPLADHIRTNRVSREHTRMVTTARMHSDLGKEMVLAASRSAVTVPVFETWLQGTVDGSFLEMPMLGRVHEVLYHRLRNADEKWEGNDLEDILTLSCAAAYADVVVGEKKTVEYLRRAEGNVPPGAKLCRNLREAVAHLDRGASCADADRISRGSPRC